MGIEIMNSDRLNLKRRACPRLLTFDYENELMTIRVDMQRQFESGCPIGAED